MFVLRLHIMEFSNVVLRVQSKADLIVAILPGRVVDTIRMNGKTIYDAGLMKLGVDPKYNGVPRGC